MEKLLTHQVPKKTLLSLQNTCLITMESPLFPAEPLPHAVTLTCVLLSHASECFHVPVTGCMQAIGSFVCLVESVAPFIICYSVEHLSVAVTVHINANRMCLSKRGAHSVSVTVGWGTARQAGRSEVWFHVRSLGFFIDLILLAVQWRSNSNEYQEYLLA